MILKKAKTIEQLKREIASIETKISKKKETSEVVSEKIKLQRKLFELKNRRLIETGQKAKRLSKRFGKGLLKAGQRAAPILKKQAKLIRDQQLRDNEIAKRLPRKKPIKKKKRKQAQTQSSQGLEIFQPLDF